MDLVSCLRVRIWTRWCNSCFWVLWRSHISHLASHISYLASCISHLASFISYLIQHVVIFISACPRILSWRMATSILFCLFGATNSTWSEYIFSTNCNTTNLPSTRITGEFEILVVCCPCHKHQYFRSSVLIDPFFFPCVLHRSRDPPFFLTHPHWSMHTIATLNWVRAFQVWLMRLNWVLYQSHQNHLDHPSNWLLNQKNHHLSVLQLHNHNHMSPFNHLIRHHHTTNVNFNHKLQVPIMMYRWVI